MWESVAHVLFALALLTEVFVLGQEVLCSARAVHTRRIGAEVPRESRPGRLSGRAHRTSVRASDV